MIVLDRPIRLLDVGDYVMTSGGVGIIIKELEVYSVFGNYVGQSVTIQHNSGCDSNPENLPVETEGDLCFVISVDQYNTEE
jgi:hypothetical protein